MTETEYPFWPAEGHAYLPEDELVDRGVYRIVSRNLYVGVWDAKLKGFNGIREKFRDRYIFMEYHWDSGGMFGTAKPLERLDVELPSHVLNQSTLHSECRSCKGIVEQIWINPEKSYADGRRCTGDTHVDRELADTCKWEGTYCGVLVANRPLFDILDPWDRKFEKERKEALKERDKWMNR